MTERSSQEGMMKYYGYRKFYKGRKNCTKITNIEYSQKLGKPGPVSYPACRNGTYVGQNELFAVVHVGNCDLSLRHVVVIVDVVT